MNRKWVEAQLQSFVDDTDRFRRQHSRNPGDEPPLMEEELIQRAAALEPVVRVLIPDVHWSLGRTGYIHVFETMRVAALRALGIVRAQEETERNLGPRGPQLSADAMHTWVWTAAASLWDTCHFRAAVQAAATSVDIRMQEKAGRRDITGTPLAQNVLGNDDPAPGKPRLRVTGDRGTPTWRARQAGLRDFAAGCFEAVRNPATHDLEEPSEQEALEQLAALSLLARWLEACEVESA